MTRATADLYRSAFLEARHCGGQLGAARYSRFGPPLRNCAIEVEIVDELIEQGFNGIFTVESQRLAHSRDGPLGRFATMKGRSQRTSCTMLSPCGSLRSLKGCRRPQAPPRSPEPKQGRRSLAEGRWDQRRVHVEPV